ncbi:MAG: hypothetical protein FD146_492 [Anaerolineaceae bacterium]|nr:MAG: hypothetical protein FD146_492 [Anaerolineaceae bacterium]
MTRRQYLLLALLGLLAAAIAAAFQPAPGYMDADYYYAGGLQLAAGRGFTEPYLWNYLDDPVGLPHPSHGYWMPLASLLAAAGALLFGPSSWLAARTGFLAVAASIPPLTAALAWSFTSRRGLALASGLLAVFSGFYLVYLPITDTFGLYMLFGGLFFLIINRQASIVNRQYPSGTMSSIVNPILLGLLSGLMHLSRADGLLWLLLAFASVLYFRKPNQSLLSIFYSLLSVLAGYLLVMAPWFARNYAAFGSFLAPGGSKTLWLTSYDQIFSYPAGRITFADWWQSGLGAILKARLWALGLNLANAISVQGGIFLWPLGLFGVWHLRRDRRVRLALLAWLLTLAAMTVVFPFAGARGGFLHSGAAVQTVWWALVPIGLDRVIEWGVRVRGWKPERARLVFPAIFIALAALLTGIVAAGRLGAGSGSGWGSEYSAHSQINEYLVLQGMPDEAVVIVANPPGFWLASGHPAIALPDGDAQTVLALARRYGARYLILEQGSVTKGLMDVYDHPADFPGLVYLGEVEGARVFELQP